MLLIPITVNPQPTQVWVTCICWCSDPSVWCVYKQFRYYTLYGH